MFDAKIIGFRVRFIWVKIPGFLSTRYIASGKLLSRFERPFLIGCSFSCASEPGEENLIVAVLQMKLTELEVSRLGPRIGARNKSSV